MSELRSKCCEAEVYDSTRQFTEMEKILDGLNNTHWADNVMHIKRCYDCHKPTEVEEKAKEKR